MPNFKLSIIILKTAFGFTNKQTNSNPIGALNIMISYHRPLFDIRSAQSQNFTTVALNQCNIIKHPSQIQGVPIRVQKYYLGLINNAMQAVHFVEWKTEKYLSENQLPFAWDWLVAPVNSLLIKSKKLWEDKWDPRLRSYDGLKSDCKSSLILVKSKQENGVFADWVKIE